jgi:uncharacterized membrane protein YbhN (UPF0104 family)
MLALRKQLPAAVASLKSAHPIALLSLVFFFAWNQVATLAWRLLLRATGVSPLPLAGLVRLRIEAQAVNQVVPTAGVAGEALRTVRAGRPSDVAAASLATLLDNVCGTVSGLAFATGALAFHLQTRGAERRLQALMVTAVVALVVLLLAVWVPFYAVPRVLPSLSATGWLRRLAAPFAERQPEMHRALRDAVGLRFAERLIAVGEIYVVFYAVGAPVSLGSAALISAVLVAVSFSVFFSPGQLGFAEAATAATGVLVGVSAAHGLAAALLRRVRQLSVCALGAVSLVVRRRASRTEPEARPAGRVK